MAKGYTAFLNRSPIAPAVALATLLLASPQTPTASLAQQATPSQGSQGQPGQTDKKIIAHADIKGFTEFKVIRFGHESEELKSPGLLVVGDLDCDARYVSVAREVKSVDWEGQKIDKISVQPEGDLHSTTL
jgi:hypothetical protein